jgi:hypothetical protein
MQPYRSARFGAEHLGFADHVNRFVTPASVRQADQKERKCWLAFTRDA